MNAKGCSHLQTYKEDPKNLETVKWIHAVFVVAATPANRRTKISNAYCRTCEKRMPFLHACLDCVYFGCHKHIREHTKTQKHGFSMDLCYGQIHCQNCNDYVYDSQIDEIAVQNKMQSGKFRKRLFEWSLWDPTEEERELLTKRTKRICIMPQSSIGLRGLLNLGSTCFMNSIVQALMHTPLLRDYFLSERHQCSSMLGMCLVCEISQVFQEFYRGASVPLVLHRMLHLIWTQSEHLAGYEQQDAHEFFLETLNILHQHYQDNGQAAPHLALQDINHTNCSCIIHKLFTGMLQSDIVCQQCKTVSTKYEPFLDLSLELGPATSLIDCLKQYTRPEQLYNKEKVLCSNCSSYQESIKQLTMKKLPIVISIHLKRFEYVKTKKKLYKKKLSTRIPFPEMLDMAPFMHKNKDDCLFPMDKRYSLFAVTNHVGGANGGHYTAFVRQQHDYWYKCDDHEITSANLQDVMDSEGYLLFYHKHILNYQ